VIRKYNPGENRDELNALAAEYSATGDLSIREKIAELAQSIVVQKALKLKRRLPKTVVFEDLISDGNLGLLDALDKYILSKGEFLTYVTPRIEGEMIDGLRMRDNLSRGQRQKVETIYKFEDDFIKQNGFRPSFEDYAEEYNIRGFGELTFLDLSLIVQVDTIVSLDTGLLSILSADSSERPLEIAMKNERYKDIHEDLESIRPKHREIIDLNLRGNSLSSVAKSVGITQGRASQIRSKLTGDGNLFRRTRDYFNN